MKILPKYYGRKNALGEILLYGINYPAKYYVELIILIVIYGVNPM
jgi:hypothetical protein